MQKQVFYKNLKALSNICLKEELLGLKKSSFKLVLGKDNLDINLKNINDNSSLYEKPLEHLEKMLRLYGDKYALYPVLYFYGFGNGILFKVLLQNERLRHIVVFESDISIIWTMFHLVDFSLELQGTRLMILDYHKMQNEDYSKLCSSKPFFDFARTYFLELSSNYYERYQEHILKVNKKLSQAFENAIIACGNDPLDALQGIGQFVHNIPAMITHASYKDLLAKRKNLSKTAIIVSTGPSLTKQLSLLKKYAHKASIFCADSAYPILAKHGIRPDYVCMLERSAFTAQFFNHDFRDIHSTLFICKSVVHPDAIKYLSRQTDNFIIVSTHANFIQYLKLDHFGYFNMGFSVSHMAYYLCAHLNYREVIFIGQDLAYAKNGHSHPKDYQNSPTFESGKKDTIKILGYGGKDYVYTHKTWLMFKQVLENDIAKIHKYLGIMTYNCTEGGARIEGSIERSFLWACKNLLKQELKKPLVKIHPPSLAKQNEFLLRAYHRIHKSIGHGRDFKEQLLKHYHKIEQDYIKMKKSEQIRAVIEHIDIIKASIDGLYREKRDLLQILGPLLTQFELNLARIYVLNPKTKEDTFNKSILWIKEHMQLIQLVHAHIDAQELALLKNLQPLEEKLRERKLDKWMRISS